MGFLIPGIRQFHAAGTHSAELLSCKATTREKVLTPMGNQTTGLVVQSAVHSAVGRYALLRETET